MSMFLGQLSRRARTRPGCTAQDASRSGDLRRPCCRASNLGGASRHWRHCSGRAILAGMRDRRCARGGTNVPKEVGIPPALRRGAAGLPASAFPGLPHESFLARAQRRMRALRMRARGHTGRCRRQLCTWGALCGRGSVSGLLLSVVWAAPRHRNHCRNLVKKGRIRDSHGAIGAARRKKTTSTAD